MKNKNYSWLVLAIACLALFSPSYTQYQLSPLAPQLIDQFNLSMSQFSSLFSAPMIPAILFSLIAGLMVDKFGIKKVIGIALVVTAIGTCLRVTATDSNTLLIYMILTGFGAAFLNANGAKIVGSYFPAEKISAMMSILLASSTLAMTLGMGTTAFFPSITSAFIFAAIISIIGTILWLLVVKNPKQTEASDTAFETASLGMAVKVVAKSRPVWIVGFCLMGIIACNIAMSSFLPTALVGRGIDAITAGGYGSIMMIGSLVGCLISPLIVSKVGKMKPVLLILAIISTLGAALAWSTPTGFLLGLNLFITGATLTGQIPLLMSIPIQLPEIGPLYAGTAGGFTATLQLMGGVLIPTFIITPIAGSDMKLFFILAGGCMAIVAALVFLLPELCSKKSEIISEPELSPQA